MSEPSCPNCKDLRSKVWLAWQCERCGWIEGASQVHDVYDAAMAWYEEMRADLAPGCEDAEFLTPCEHELLAVCRRAKEGR